MEDGSSPKLSHVLFGKLEIFYHTNEHMLSESFNDVDPPFLIKMTQINFVSRNQLHNTANSCQHLNFGLSWLG